MHGRPSSIRRLCLKATIVCLNVGILGCSSSSGDVESGSADSGDSSQVSDASNPTIEAEHATDALVDDLDASVDPKRSATDVQDASDCVGAGGQCLVVNADPSCPPLTRCPNGTTGSYLSCGDSGAQCCLPRPVDPGMTCTVIGGMCFPFKGSCELNCGQIVANECPPSVAGGPQSCCLLPPCTPLPIRYCALMMRCGPISDGCGGIIDCGDCGFDTDGARGICQDGGVCTNP
jgi:hypothetical protein